MDSGDKCLDSITGSEYFIITIKGVTFKNCESLYYIPVIYITYISNISVYKSAKEGIGGGVDLQDC